MLKDLISLLGLTIGDLLLAPVLAFTDLSTFFSARKINEPSTLLASVAIKVFLSIGSKHTLSQIANLLNFHHQSWIHQ